MDGSAPPASGQGVLSLESWDQPPRRLPGPAAAPVLAVDGFEGPLDWLLDLARTRRIDLARLSILALVEAFAEALTAALATPDLRPTLLGRWGDWLVMAADLTLLRSRLLVPADAAAAKDAQDEAERLRQRLLGRAEIGRAADWLEGRAQLGRDVFRRGQPDGARIVRAKRTGDLTALLRACLVAIRLPVEAGTLYRVPGPPFWSVSDAAARIRAMLPEVGEEGAALEAFLPEVPIDAPEREVRCRVAVAGTFLAGLELTREGSIGVEQDAAWSSIQVRPAQGMDAAELEAQVEHLQGEAAKTAAPVAQEGEAKRSRRGRPPGRKNAIDPGDAVPPGLAVLEPAPMDPEAEAARNALEEKLSEAQVQEDK